MSFSCYLVSLWFPADCSTFAMPGFRQKKIRTLTLLFCIITFSTFLFSYTFLDTSSDFFKYAFRLSDNFFSKDHFFSKGFCSCRPHCMREEEDDLWFTERFNQSVHPLMTTRNSALSQETFRWWQWLQSFPHPANYSHVVEKLFQVIPDEELYMDAGPDRCRTCSVVGNSGNLIGTHYGRIIDLSDIVIRMNKAPISGYEKDVGTRTTHHVMYPESARDLDNNTSLVLIPYKTMDLQWMISALTTGTVKHTYQAVVSRIKANKDRVLIYNPAFFKYVYDTWLEGHGRYPSTGFLTLMFAIHICDEVSLFGFGADHFGNWHHYWEDTLGGAFRLTGVHDGSYEYNVTLLLAEKHKIKFFKGR